MIDLESKVGKLSDEQKHTITAKVIWGHTLYTEEGILLLEGEENNYKRIEGIKEITHKLGYSTEPERAINPEVIVTPYRIAAIGRMSHGTGKYTIIDTAVDKYITKAKKATSIWFNYNPEEPEFMKMGKIFGRGYTGLKSFTVMPATMTGLVGKTIDINQQLIDLKNKTKQYAYVLRPKWGADINQILNTILEFQNNPKIITLSRAYDYFMKDPELAKILA